MHDLKNSDDPGGIVRELADQVAAMGPLTIDEIDHPEPVVTLIGKTWSMSMLCPWRLMRDGTLIVDPDHMEQPYEVAVQTVTDALWELVGLQIVQVRHSLANINDPIFDITGGYSIEIASDTDVDPWVISLPGGTYVGTMSSPMRTN